MQFFSRHAVRKENNLNCRLYCNAFEQDRGRLQWRRLHVRTILSNFSVKLNSDALKKERNKPTGVCFHFLFGSSTFLWKDRKKSQPARDLLNCVWKTSSPQQTNTLSQLMEEERNKKDARLAHGMAKKKWMVENYFVKVDSWLMIAGWRMDINLAHACKENKAI